MKKHFSILFLFFLSLGFSQVSVGKSHIGLFKDFSKNEYDLVKKKSTIFVVDDLEIDLFSKMISSIWTFNKYQVVDRESYEQNKAKYITTDYAVFLISGDIHTVTNTKTGFTTEYVHLNYNYFYYDNIKIDMNMRSRIDSNLNNKINNDVNNIMNNNINNDVNNNINNNIKIKSNINNYINTYNNYTILYNYTTLNKLTLNYGGIGINHTNWTGPACLLTFGFLIFLPSALLCMCICNSCCSDKDKNNSGKTGMAGMEEYDEHTGDNVL